MPESTNQGDFFIAPVQTTPPRPQNNRWEAITLLLDSVAKQQEALARILDAETRK